MQTKTGPFLRSTLTIEKIMYDVLLALLPAVIAGVVFFGHSALVVLLLSTLSAVITEAIFLRAPFTVKGILGDGSALVTGLLVGLILPPTTAWWIPVLGSFLAISLVKLAFGGIGHNIFNPALGARAILLLAFTSQLVKFTVPFDTITAATPLLTSRSFSWSLVWGNVGGSIGETSVIAILLGAIYLLYKGHINWRIPVGYVGSAFALALLLGLDPWYTITAGGLLFAAAFMATDMVTSPVTPVGELLFGIGCGVLTIVIRQFTPFPEGVTFAVLTMNALAPILESITIPTIFGVSLSKKTRVQTGVVAASVFVVLIGILFSINIIRPTVTPIISNNEHLPITEMLGSADFEVVYEDGVTYYLTRDNEGDPAEVVLIASQGGFNAPIEFLLVLDNKHEIQDIKILDHKEDPGLGELITRDSFLRQFVGLDQNSPFGLGEDIQGITGATISSRALASGVNKAFDKFADTFYPQEGSSLLTDGTYKGKANSFGGVLEVEVDVSSGKISRVEVTKHTDTPGISDGAFAKVPGRIVDQNETKVDAVSGATVTSDAIMKAVQNALDSASTDQVDQSSAGFEIAVDDGIYQGSAKGFGGNFVMDVTVKEGKITELQVVESNETPFIADSALKKLLPAILEAQGHVDTISGATVTSKAVFEAIENALGAGEDTSESTQSQKSFNISVGDGVYQGSAKGFGGDLVIEVTIKSGEITELEIVESKETPFIAEGALKKLLPAILEAQGHVDTISGATVTSKAVFEAIENALGAGEDTSESTQSQKSFNISVGDGVYQGSAKGFGGDLVIEVTIKSGEITELEIVESKETPFIAEGAFKRLIPAIIEAQGPVDMISGATVTSNAVMEALENAISIKEAR